MQYLKLIINVSFEDDGQWNGIVPRHHQRLRTLYSCYRVKRRELCFILYS